MGQPSVAVGVEVRQDFLKFTIMASRSDVLCCLTCAKWSGSSVGAAPGRLAEKNVPSQRVVMPDGEESGRPR